MTYAPASRASWVAIEPTAPAAPCTRTLCPARRRPCSNSPCHAVRPGITRAAPTVKSTSPGSGARLRASTATYSASVPSRVQSVRPNTRCPNRQPRRSIAEGGDHSGQLVAGDRRCPVTAEAIDPGRRPRELIPSESRRMNLDNDIAVIRARDAGERCPLRLGPLYQLHPGRSRSLVRHHDRLHGNCLIGHLSLWWKCCRDGKPVRHLIRDSPDD